jgi:hypothetical protein
LAPQYLKCEHSLLTFYISRVMRIYPLAIVATLLMGVITLTNWETVAWNAALFGLKLGAALNPPAWCLAIEVQFYLIAPLLFWVITDYRWAMTIVAMESLGGLHSRPTDPYIYLDVHPPFCARSDLRPETVRGDGRTPSPVELSRTHNIKRFARFYLAVIRYRAHFSICSDRSLPCVDALHRGKPWKAVWTV